MRLACSNQKGGVGKTTVAINTAGALVELGNDVLLVDLDPQGYLTSGVGMDNAYTADGETLYHALKNPGGHDVDDLTRDHAEFDVLPASIEMFNLEQELVSAMRGRERFEMLFEGHDTHDFVVVDCPPSLGILTDNALLGCGNLLIPAEAEDTSIRALELLFKQIETLEANYNTRIRERALVVSNVDYPLDKEQQGMLAWFRDRFDGRMPIFEVRQRAAIKRAYNDGVSIFGSDEECDQRDSLRALAEALTAAQGAPDA